MELAALVPEDRLLVAESGVRSHDDLLALRAAGISTVLVGETLMRAQDVEEATRRLLGRA
jgi:indole-3-glycerol phosphate synthase